MLGTNNQPFDQRLLESDQEMTKCKRCLSQLPGKFSGEVAIHFKGLAGLDKPIVWVFPQIAVCLKCGCAEFFVPEKELQVLKTGTPVEGAAVWLGSSQE